MAAAKKPWADLIDGPGKAAKKSTDSADQPAKPETPPNTVYMHTVIGNPGNPRTELDYTDEDAEFRELKDSMRSVGQLQPAVAMSSDAFRRAKPEHADAIGDAEWVVILGNRRYHAAKQLGWTKFEIRVRDRLGSAEDDKVDEAVVIENIHRKNIPPYKEAEFLQRMVDRHGSQEKVAERIGKSQMYVSNRLALLNLTPELRDVVDTKQIKVKTAEQIAKIKDPEEQKARAAEEIQKAAQPKERKPRRPRTSPALSLVQNPVLNQGPAEASQNATATMVSSENQGQLVQSPVPEPRPGTDQSHLAAGGASSPPVPWHNGASLMDLAFTRLDDRQRSLFIQRYFQRSQGVEQVAADMTSQLRPEDCLALAAILQQVSTLMTKHE
ncbi:ParB/RepB/Spo0J family partition protein [Streptomyces sp. NBC_00378]|uniref:ParB/RepB/Spo0J family partition protein n=1 Tax=unclassified Streptomyces TaxID=2593676 RepID=UPI002253E80F|nr:MULTISPECIES: ParB/RepB/Spo0J family partition protein [unclassified Streptomyces]MCX5115239.1 ParB/RepB/Spo0J family partition protein [Streptomyces sp. NBC_00378]